MSLYFRKSHNCNLKKFPIILKFKSISNKFLKFKINRLFKKFQYRAQV